ALAGCGGDGGGRTPAPRIDRAAAADLAERSDEIARLIDDGDVCGAAHRADELRARAQEEIDDGSVPEALASQLVANADALVNEVNCEEPPPPPETDEDEEDNRGEGKGKGKKKDGGDD
ncbi:MAG: hypothetical protein ACRDNN_17070, partial [Gaiellaceae bacterium]